MLFSFVKQPGWSLPPFRIIFKFPSFASGVPKISLVCRTLTNDLDLLPLSTFANGTSRLGKFSFTSAKKIIYIVKYSHALVIINSCKITDRVDECSYGLICFCKKKKKQMVKTYPKSHSTSFCFWLTLSKTILRIISRIKDTRKRSWL